MAIYAGLAGLGAQFVGYNMNKMGYDPQTFGKTYPVPHQMTDAESRQFNLAHKKLPDRVVEKAPKEYKDFVKGVYYGFPYKKHVPIPPNHRNPHSPAAKSTALVPYVPIKKTTVKTSSYSPYSGKRYYARRYKRKKYYRINKRRKAKK